MTDGSTAAVAGRAPADSFSGDYLGEGATDALLAFLEARRLALGLGHNAFARDVLRMGQARWSLIRRGVEPAGPAFIGRVVSAVPEAADVIRRHSETAPV